MFDLKDLNKKVIRKLIDDAMEKKDRYVTIYVGETGVHISIYPLTEDDEKPMF